MSQRIPLPCEPFSVADARDAGISTKRLRGPDLARPFRGIRAPLRPVDALAAVEAFLPRLQQGHAFTAASAAAVWGLPVPHFLDVSGRVTIGLAKSSTRTTIDGVICRELKPALFRTRVVDGIPVTDPLLTWCVLARDCSVNELVKFGDALVSDNRAYVGRRADFDPVTLAELARAVAAWRGCVGVEKLRTALPYVQGRVASPPESDLRMFLIDRGLPLPEVNAVLHRQDGTFLACVDLYIRECRLVFEYEGDGHRTDQQQFRKDITRIGEVEAQGNTVVRVTADDLYRQPEVFGRRVDAAFELAVIRTAKSA